MRALIAALLLLPTAAITEETNTPDPNFGWLVAFLEENSSITLAATAETPRESISTRTQGRIVYGDLIIEYDRLTYQADTPDEPKQHQKILYSADLAAIDPGTVRVQRVGESAPGVPFWMVSFGVRENPGFSPTATSSSTTAKRRRRKCSHRREKSGRLRWATWPPRNSRMNSLKNSGHR